MRMFGSLKSAVKKPGTLISYHHHNPPPRSPLLYSDSPWLAIATWIRERESAPILLVQGVRGPVVRFKICVDFSLVRVVVGERRVDLRQRQMAAKRLYNLLRNPRAIRRTETPVPAMHGLLPRISGFLEIRLPISTATGTDLTIGDVP